MFAIGVKFDLTVEGRLRGGIILHWKDVSATIDFLDPSKTEFSNWSPTPEKVFEARGTITATITPYATVSLEFPVEVLGGITNKLSTKIALTEKAGVAVTATLSAATSTQEDTSKCSDNGVSIDAKFTSELYLVLPKLDNINLFTPDPVLLFNGCAKL